MLRDRLLIGSALLVAGACSRVPADVSGRTPDVVSATADAPAKSKPSFSKDCAQAELAICIESCSDAECLEWCAGRECVAAVHSFTACLDTAVDQAAADGPRPPLVYETHTDVHDDYEGPTSESLERQAQWDKARQELMSDQWSRTCHAECVERLGPEADEIGGFCINWQRHQPHMKRSSPPVEGKSEVDAGADMIEVSATLDLASGSMRGLLGPSVWLTSNFGAQRGDIHAIALAQMLEQTSRYLGSTADCIPGRGEDGEDVVVNLQFGPSGEVEAAARDRSPEHDCVAERVAKVVRIPARVAHDFPRVEVTVRVHPPLRSILGEVDVMGDTFDTGVLEGGSDESEAKGGGGMVYSPQGS